MIATQGEKQPNESQLLSSLRTASLALQAVSAVLGGQVQSALAVVRPPGHHAECSRAQGFCFFNNCATAARAALQTPGITRLAIVDWDVHSGHGVQQVRGEQLRTFLCQPHLQCMAGLLHWQAGLLPGHPIGGRLPDPSCAHGVCVCVCTYVRLAGAVDPW